MVSIFAVIFVSPFIFVCVFVCFGLGWNKDVVSTGARYSASMKVLVVNAYFSRGGAARAAQRLAAALTEVGIDVEYISVFPDSMSWRARFEYLLRAFVDRIPGYLLSRKRVMFSQGRLSHPAVVNRLVKSDADIVHFHWMQGGALSFDDMLSVNKPVFVSLHDMWLFTGGCHYDDECGRYSDSCGSCPVLTSFKDRDLSFYNLESKRRSILKHGLNHVSIVGLSQWLARAARSSSLFREARVYNLPNPINTNVFYPREAFLLRKQLRISSSRKIVLFGAMQSDDVRKGGDFLRRAISKMNRHNVSLVIFGGGGESFSLFEDVHVLGHIGTDEELAVLYSGADVMVVPSLQENLSNAVMESMACGTPVVAFDTGGNGDMIDHLKNGYLARLRDVDDLAQGIDWIIHNSEMAELRTNARGKVLREFDQLVVAEKYKTLYKEVLGN